MEESTSHSTAAKPAAIQKDEPETRKLNEKNTKSYGRVVKFLKEQGESSLFAKACKAVSIPLTKRQASKWLRHMGAAWKFGR